MSDTRVLHPNKILFAIDGSENSLSAAATLRDLPLPPGAEITALAVQPVTDLSATPVYEALLIRAEKYFLEAGKRIETRLLQGHPAEVIINYAEAYEPDLIVMGAVGLRATLGILLGGIAQQVVEYASCPVLVVRGAYLGIKNVLVVTDGSPASQKAIDYMANFTLPKEVTLHAMHVLPPAPSPERIAHSWGVAIEAIEPVSLQELRETLEKDANEEARCKQQALLGPVVQRFSDLGMNAQCVLRRGDAATEILRYSTDYPMDWVVSGSRGLSQVRSWLLGSVSRKLVHYAHCSVLIVK